MYLFLVIIRGKYTSVITEYRQCPNTDTLSISETINPTNECFMNKFPIN